MKIVYTVRWEEKRTTWVVERRSPYIVGMKNPDDDLYSKSTVGDADTFKHGKEVAEKHARGPLKWQDAEDRTMSEGVYQT